MFRYRDTQLQVTENCLKSTATHSFKWEKIVKKFKIYVP